MNRLKDETSPYLKQHSTNPVDWYPWSEEAFTASRELNKPIFLSIGYSTCHWCHVMEKESFEDYETANLLNDSFVCIKVDREERPDIDLIYMKVCQELTGSGGWPLSIIMTNEKYPFFAATYIPREDINNSIGLKNLSKRVKEYWDSNSNLLVKQSKEIINTLQKRITHEIIDEINIEPILHKNYSILKNSFDIEHGGFGNAPKFPQPHLLQFLLNYGRVYKSDYSLKMVESTLEKILSGGIYDQIGFGIHRYSTDRYWRIPHFEKMLYDQCMLILLLSEVYQTTKNIYYKQIVSKTISYLSDKLSSPNGGFYCGEDADSEGFEGRSYLWKYEELKSILGKDIHIFEKIFSVSEDGNFENGYNILYYSNNYDTILKNNGINKEEFLVLVKKWSLSLSEVRSKRIQPHVDTKVTSDWNGLAIAALAKASYIFSEKSYLTLAKSSLEYILTYLYKGNKVYHYLQSGQKYIDGFLNDYSFLIFGIIHLYLTELKRNYLELAIELNEMAMKEFYNNGKLFFRSKNAEEEILVLDDPYDGAIPSGISVSYNNNILLYKITGDSKYKQTSENILRYYYGVIKNNPYSLSFMLNGYLLGQKKYLKVNCPENMINTEEFRKFDNVIITLSVEKERNNIQVCDEEKCMMFQTYEETSCYIKSLR